MNEIRISGISVYDEGVLVLGGATKMDFVGGNVVATLIGNTIRVTVTPGSASLTNTHIFVGNAGNVATDVALSGDATMANTGALTLASTIVAGGPIGSATATPIITYDAKGRLTTVSSATVTPAVGSITGLAAGVAAFLATPSSANLITAVTDETGSGVLVFATNPTLGGLTLTDATNIVLNTTTGSKIGTATTQKLGFYNATPVAQQGATIEIGVALSNLGLRAVGTAYPITTSGAVTLGSLTATRIPFAGTAGLLGDSANFTWNASGFLSVGLASASYRLHVQAASGSFGIVLTDGTATGGIYTASPAATGLALGYGTFSNHPLIFTTNNGSPQMILSTTGRLYVGGSVAPTAVVHLAAGTATASTAPLKFTAGTLLGTTEIGAMEFVDDGTTGHLYITVNIATVKTRVQIV